MTDDFDRASDREQKERELAIEAARKRVALMPFIGACYFCGEDLKDGRRFCDSDCRDLYQSREAARKRNGQS